MTEKGMFEEMMNCDDCRGAEKGVFPCEEHEEKYQDEVVYLPDGFVIQHDEAEGRRQDQSELDAVLDELGIEVLDREELQNSEMTAVVCMHVENIDPSLVVPGSEKQPCSECGDPVWVGPATQEHLERGEIDAPIVGMSCSYDEEPGTPHDSQDKGDNNSMV